MHSRYTSVALKIGASFLGIVGLGMGVIQIFFVTFGWEGIYPSYLGMVVSFAVFAAEILMLIALVILWWRPHIAGRLFMEASALFFGSLVYLCVVFAHL